jgi:hypothetical protein
VPALLPTLCRWVTGHPCPPSDPPCPAGCRDETTVLALNGLTKVLRAHMAAMLATDGWEGKW